MTFTLNKSRNERWENKEMDTDDGWPKIWADRLRHYLFLAANSPLQHAKRIAQLVAEAASNKPRIALCLGHDNRGRVGVTKVVAPNQMRIIRQRNGLS